MEICRGKTVFAGAPSADFSKRAAQNGTRVFDYATEALLTDNAYLTAEGAVGIAVSDMPVAVRGADILVIGCGRIGRALSVLLKSMGAKVSVTALREESRVWAEECGFGFIRTDSMRDAATKSLNAVFNTVPRPVFGTEEIKMTGPDCILVELASRPGGIDGTAAGALGRHYINAAGLPGKTAPMSASEIIYREIKRILETEEI